MNITGPLIVLIANNPTAATLTGGKVYPVVAPQTTVPPYVVMRITEVQPTHHKDGVSPLDAILVQVSTLAKEYHYTQRTDEAVRRAIDGYRGNVTLDGALVAIDGTQYLTGEDLFEPDGDLFRRDARYRVRLKRDGTTVSGGTPGGSTDFSLIEVQAGETISTGRVVIQDNELAYLFQPSNPAHAGRAIGVSKTSATTGVSLSVQISGRVYDPGITAIADSPCFVGANGQILPAYPGTGLLQKCGVGIDDHTMQIDFSQQIQRIA